MIRRNIIISQTPETAAEEAVFIWQKTASRAILTRGHYTMALSGGMTPDIFYRKLSDPAHRFLWEKISIFLVDERFVPYTDSQSNYAMINDHLFKRIPIPPQNVFPIPIRGTPQNSALEYDAKLRSFFRVTPARPIPRFDLIVLGIGQDGRTASLFEGDPRIYTADRFVIATKHLSLPHPQISMTLALINNAAHVMFLVTGRHKARTVFEVLNQAKETSATKVSPATGELTFVLDKEAGSLVKDMTK
ncbi:MAG: 6-phosphogluconolactonase [Candidatus Omnitrophica bacterium]|nr:6-phosphogluconolactonase [Candidatus Omnitrophota bacterium]